MKIFQVYPFLTVITAQEGVSSSEAQRIKEQNKNEAAYMLLDLEVNPERLYSTKRDILSATGVVNEISKCENPHTIEDFKCLEKVQELYAESAVLGSGLKLLTTIREELSTMKVEDLATLLNMSKTFIVPQLKSCLRNKYINSFCEEDSVERLLLLSNTKLLEAVGHLFKKGLEIEAKAAVLGNQYTKPDKLIRTISTLSNKQLPVKETANILVYTEKIVAVDKEAFKAYEESLASSYTELQKERNYIVKQIKDAAREIESQYNKEYQAQLNQYNADKKEFESMIEGVRLELLQEAASLKILK